MLLVLTAAMLAGCRAADDAPAGAPPAAAPAAGAGASERVEAPYFEVDPLWPQPLPNHWVLGSVVGVSVDDRDHVWIVHRPQSLGANERGLEREPPIAECCRPAPPVVEFDPDGRLVTAWGGPGDGYDWPESNHGITVDRTGTVWLGGSGDGDAHVLAFSRDGTFLRQFGRARARSGPPQAPGGVVTWIADSHDRSSFGRVAKITVDTDANEAYLADGYLNKRVVVIDTGSGEVKRYWGAYGNRPDDADPGTYAPDAPPAPQFRSPVHCAELSRDGLVYVCDRLNNRIQVFRRDGTFVKEGVFARQTLEGGSVSDIAFSADEAQTYLFVTDLLNAKVRVVRRETLDEVTSFGGGGRQPGQFYGPHNIAADSAGNLFTTETFEGKRVQKFIYRGMRAVAREQGVVWPR